MLSLNGHVYYCWYMLGIPQQKIYGIHCYIWYIVHNAVMCQNYVLSKRADMAIWLINSINIGRSSKEIIVCLVQNIMREASIDLYEYSADMCSTRHIKWLYGIVSLTCFASCIYNQKHQREHHTIYKKTSNAGWFVALLKRCMSSICCWYCWD